MRSGLTVPTFGDYFDPRLPASLARDAERAGWDGLFGWDHEVREVAAFIGQRRSGDAPFDVVVVGHTSADDAMNGGIHSALPRLRSDD